jgi:hypothetical protein
VLSRRSLAQISVGSDFPFQGFGPRFCPSSQNVNADTDRKIDDNEQKARPPTSGPIERPSSRGVGAFARHRSISSRNLRHRLRLEVWPAIRPNRR